MPKEIQPLENVAKIYYAATFPPELSLLLLERKSTTLQHMFTNYLEVEENLMMSKKLSGQDSGGEIKDTLKLVGPYKQNGKVRVQLKLSLGINKDDQPDIGAYGSVEMFSKDCDLHHPRSIQGDFKKEFIAHVYDEYEE